MCNHHSDHNHCECHHHEHHHEHHHHEHHHNHGILSQLIPIIISVILLIIIVLVDHNLNLEMWQRLVLYLVPYLIVGHSTIKEAIEGIIVGDVFNEHFLMTLATVGALSIGFMPEGKPEFVEAVFVMLFFQIGEFFESYAEGQSKRSIAHLMDIRPDTANIKREGRLLTVNASEVALGEIITVKPGERIPLDGTIVEGSSTLDTAALTGESLPKEVHVGDNVTSGCVNLSGVLHVKTQSTYKDSTVSKILQLVENAAERKSSSEAFISRFARVYTPIVVLLAVGVACIPPLFADSYAVAFTKWLYNALTFLIVSCPCALVISVPLTFFAGMGAASRRGILVKGANYIDLLARLDNVVFDKTGTLTRGHFVVTAIHPEKIDADQLLHLAAHVEHFTSHPIGATLRDSFPKESCDGCKIDEVEEIAGQGVRAKVTLYDTGISHIVSVGNSKLMENVGAKWHPCHHSGTIIHVAIDGIYAGHIVISDQVKQESKEAIERLRQLGVKKTIMLTGDSHEVADTVAKELNIDEWHANLLPSDKVTMMEQLTPVTAFVGDGINDAPVIARADVGIAMGGLGSDAAIDAADVVLMDDNPLKVATAITIARRTIRVAQENIVFAITVKLAVLILAIFSLSTLGMAIFADVGVTVLAVFNAMRAAYLLELKKLKKLKELKPLVFFLEYSL